MKGTGSDQGNFYYGWTVMAAGLIIAMLGLGIRYSYGVFLSSFETEFAFNRSSVSGIFSFYMLACCIVAIAGGWALDRFGPRPVGLSMALFCFAGLFITSMAQNRWHLLWAYGLFLSLGTGPIYTVVNSTVSRWFVKRRGLALGITSSGGGAGAIVVPPIATYLILQNGWRSSSLAIGICAGLIMAAMALLLRKEPSAKGLASDGAGPRANDSGGHQIPDRQGLSLSDAVKTVSFWALFISWLLISLNVHMIFVHTVPYTVEKGVFPIHAAFALSIIGAANIPGRLIVGSISDMVDRRPLGVVCAVAQACVLVWLPAIHDVFSLYLFSIVFGLTWGGVSTIVTVLIGDAFGTVSIGSIMGVLSSGWSLGAAAGPALGGFCFHFLGDYSLSFFLGSATMVITSIALPFIISEKERAQG